MRSEDYVRIPREDLEEGLQQLRRGRLEATRAFGEAVGPVLATARRIRVFLTGRPLDTEALQTERLSILRALPVLSSDALSSVAYGPEAGLAVLAAAGASAFLFNAPIGIAIALLMIIVTTSYRQVVHGYQGGGGSYAVARANLGLGFGLVTAGALLVDYVLTVAVSVSSGVDALASAFTPLVPYTVVIGLLLIALVMVGNLRGVREAGAIFAGPTYVFIGAMLVLIVVGLVLGLLGHHAAGRYAPVPATTALTPLLILTAFASGSSSMTGIEAVSNSVPSFQPPRAVHAARTLTILGVLLVVLFLGVVALDLIYGAEPRPSGSPTVLSQLASAVFHGPAWPVYYVFQFATLLVLVLAANTSFNGFPRLCAILAGDDLLPHHFALLGSRLVYSTGIVLLAATAAVLVVVFGGNTDSLINLYALGVFTAFTLAQLGMARHWERARSRGWLRRAAINGVGAAITALVGVIIIVTKAPRGAWVVLILVPLLVILFWSISRFYAGVRARLSATVDQAQFVAGGPAIVLVRQLDDPARSAVRYAMAVFDEVKVVHLARNTTGAAELERDWRATSWAHGRRAPELRTIVRRPPARIREFLDVLDQLRAAQGGRVTTVVLPERQPPLLFRGLLEQPWIAFARSALLRRHDVVTLTVPAGAPDATRAPADHVAIVPVASMEAPARRALAYASTVAGKTIAVHVETEVEGSPARSRSVVDGLRAWPAGPSGRPRLTVIESPYRSVVAPIVAYVDSWRKAHPELTCTVVLADLMTDRWWAYWLHCHRASRLMTELATRPTAVATVTYHLRRSRS